MKNRPNLRPPEHPSQLEPLSGQSRSMDLSQVEGAKRHTGVRLSGRKGDEGNNNSNNKDNYNKESTVRAYCDGSHIGDTEAWSSVLEGRDVESGCVEDAEGPKYF